MSRSRKHLPIRGLLPAESEKAEKQRWHRVMRRRERQRLGVLPPEQAEAHLTLVPHEVCDDLTLGKHGKEYVADADEAADAVRK